MALQLSAEAQRVLDANGEGQECIPPAVCCECGNAEGYCLYVREGARYGSKSFVFWGPCAENCTIRLDVPENCKGVCTLVAREGLIQPSCLRCAGLRLGGADMHNPAHLSIVRWRPAWDSRWRQPQLRRVAREAGEQERREAYERARQATAEQEKQQAYARALRAAAERQDAKYARQRQAAAEKQRHRAEKAFSPPERAGAGLAAE